MLVHGVSATLDRSTAGILELAVGSFPVPWKKRRQMTETMSGVSSSVCKVTPLSRVVDMSLW
jgi:hypothetical protein